MDKRLNAGRGLNKEFRMPEDKICISNVGEL